MTVDLPLHPDHNILPSRGGRWPAEPDEGGRHRKHHVVKPSTNENLPPLSQTDLNRLWVAARLDKAGLAGKLTVADLQADLSLR